MYCSLTLTGGQLSVVLLLRKLDRQTFLYLKRLLDSILNLGRGQLRVYSDVEVDCETKVRKSLGSIRHRSEDRASLTLYHSFTHDTILYLKHYYNNVSSLSSLQFSHSFLLTSCLLGLLTHRGLFFFIST